ncbi:heavy-metal-associated domain-containing protein [Halolamina litorea]|uniref:Heavy-metal-associated domain-containing protein n=1 Tax=Halolamina litorea TaxID=1515593 RepID=A0ABD6BQL9_9EURY|nr:heavy metal-associated domain-containing protein [Halolamina litorea]
MAQKLSVDGMSCGGCEASVEEAVGELDGVESVEADNEANTVDIEGDVDTDAAVDAIEDAGYTVQA